MRHLLLAAMIGICLIDARVTSAQNRADVEAITAAALDYGVGWYEGDAGRLSAAGEVER